MQFHEGERSNITNILQGSPTTKGARPSIARARHVNTTLREDQSCQNGPG